MVTMARFFRNGGTPPPPFISLLFTARMPRNNPGLGSNDLLLFNARRAGPKFPEIAFSNEILEILLWP
jgi:hypothetical protein